VYANFIKKKIIGNERTTLYHGLRQVDLLNSCLTFKFKGTLGDFFHVIF